MNWIYFVLGILVVGGVGAIIIFTDNPTVITQEDSFRVLEAGTYYNLHDAGETTTGPGNTWMWTHVGGDEVGYSFPYVHEQNSGRTQLCMIAREGVPVGQLPQSINVYDLDGNFLFTVDRELIDIEGPYFQDWGWCRSVDFEIDSHFLRFGEGSIIFEWVDIAMVQFVNDWVEVNTTLLWITIPNQTAMNDVFVIDQNISFKFGANHSGTQSGEENRYKYIVQSSLPIIEYGYGVYIIQQNQSIDCYGNPFAAPLCADPKYEFTDIIEAFEFNYTGDRNHTCVADDFFNENEDCLVTFDTNVSFLLSEDNKTLEVEFNSKHNDTLGFTRIDPTVTFSTNTVDGISMDVISPNEYIVFWCDETADDRTFSTFNTNGSILAGPSDLDSAAGACSIGIAYEVDVKILDEENNRAAAIWRGSTGTGVTTTFNYVIPGFTTNRVWSGSRIFGVSLVVLNTTRYAGSYIDSSQEDASTIVFDQVGNNITPIFDIATAIGKDSKSIASTSFGDDQNYSVIWFDASDREIKLITINFTTGGDLGVMDIAVVVDTLQSSGNGAVAIDSFNEDQLVVGWFDVFGIGGGIKFATYYINLSIITSETSIEPSPGIPFSVAVSTINTTAFAESWHDATDVDIDFEVWDISGTQLVDKVVAFSLSASAGAQDILSTNTNTGICRDRLIVAGTDTGGISMGETKTFFTNGTIWEDGQCPCLYTITTEDWNTICDCNITEDVNLKGNSLIINGPGLFHVIGANISDATSIKVTGLDSDNICRLRLSEGAQLLS